MKVGCCVGRERINGWYIGFTKVTMHVLKRRKGRKEMKREKKGNEKGKKRRNEKGKRGNEKEKRGNKKEKKE